MLALLSIMQVMQSSHLFSSLPVCSLKLEAHRSFMTFFYSYELMSGFNRQAIGAAIAALEAAGGISTPAFSPAIEGSWELLYTSRSAFDPLNPLGARVDGSRPGLEGFIPTILRPINAAAAAVTRASSSPIQRTVTAIDGLRITQDICLVGKEPRVDQRVAFGSAYLRLSAAASVDESSPARVSLAFSRSERLSRHR
jgi:hypothetical protein